MKCTRIYYEKCFNLGNYQNEKIGVEVELAENETAQQALDTAKRFVEKNKPGSGADFERAKLILENKELYTYKQVTEAQALIDNQPKEDDLPF